MPGRELQILPLREKCTKNHYNCQEVPDNLREAINGYMRTLLILDLKDDIEQFVLNYVARKSPTIQLKKSSRDTNHKRYFHDYYLPYFAGEEHLVCRREFLNVTGLKHWSVRNWMGENDNFIPKRLNRENQEYIPLRMRLRKQHKYLFHHLLEMKANELNMTLHDLYYSLEDCFIIDKPPHK